MPNQDWNKRGGSENQKKRLGGYDPGHIAQPEHALPTHE